MTAVDMRADLSLLTDAASSGDLNQMIAAARTYLQDGKAADVLLGRLSLTAARGDKDGHRIITLAALSMLGRLTHWIPAPVGESTVSKEQTLPLFVQGLKVAAPAVRAALQTEEEYPHPFFPSELIDTDKTITQVFQEAINQNNTDLAERVLLGFYGTGADYRTLQLHTYIPLAITFVRDGHPIQFAVRGYQILDAVEWGKRVPPITHWLAPLITVQPDDQAPAWQEIVRSYLADPQHDVRSVRTRLASSNNNNALPLRQLLLSNADTQQICQGVYDALVPGLASPRAIATVIELAAADLLERVSDDNRKQFVQFANGLLVASSVRNLLSQVQDIAVLGHLFTAAAYINALAKELPAQAVSHDEFKKGSGAAGGLIAVTQLEALSTLLKEQKVGAAYATAQRYLHLGHDPRALFGTIGLIATRNDAEQDQGHSLQITLAASEAYLHWSSMALKSTSPDILLQVALRAALFGPQDTDIIHLDS